MVGSVVTVIVSVPGPLGARKARLTELPASTEVMAEEGATRRGAPAPGSLCVARPNSNGVRSSAVSIDAGVTNSTMRSTRRPGCMSPLPPPCKPAAGGSSPLSTAVITRSTALSAIFGTATAGTLVSPRVIMTIEFCSVRISVPCGTTSPTDSGRHTPSVPRM